MPKERLSCADCLYWDGQLCWREYLGPQLILEEFQVSVCGDFLDRDVDEDGEAWDWKEPMSVPKIWAHFHEHTPEQLTAICDQLARLRTPVALVEAVRAMERLLALKLHRWPPRLQVEQEAFQAEWEEARRGFSAALARIDGESR